MGYRHTPFFNLVELLKQDGCPFCRTVNAAGHRYLRTTLYEFVNDPSVRNQTAQSRGFCLQHADVLRALTDPLGVVLLHETLIHKLLRSASDAELFAAPEGICPACRYVEESLNLQLSTFVDNHDEPEIQQYLSTRPQICFPHLRQLAKRTRNKVLLRQLAAATRRQLEALDKKIHEFVAAENATLEQRSSPDLEGLAYVWLDCLQFFSGSVTSASEEKQP
ncbi:MAG: DUF6062 family protein [Candidatus Sumerlaeaceae bacterium]|nr:DUF6062 family protein [Candidatus Sumerlaeaceae bacterium]